MPIQAKIKTRKEIVGLCRNFQKRKKIVVTYNGSFDILHLGHITSLQEARAQGDILIVPLNSDKSVHSYKGPNHPIVPEDERAQTIAALGCVDYVVLFDEINPKEILNKIKPDIHCKGADWGKDCIEREVVEKNGGKIHILKTVPGLSTSALIKRIINLHSKPEVRAVFLDRDGTINANKPEYLHKKEDFKFIPGALPALKKLSQTDYKLIVVTNQSGISRGYFAEKDLEELHRFMLSQFKKSDVRVDEVYYCPHAQEDNCPCRKPKIGMVRRAADKFGINLSKSWMVGDSSQDILMGREANIQTIFVGKKYPANLKIRPHYYAKDLAAAVKIILQ